MLQCRQLRQRLKQNSQEKGLRAFAIFAKVCYNAEERKAILRFRTEDDFISEFVFVHFDGDERVHNSQLEKDFEDMLSDTVDLLDLEYISRREAYRISDEQEQFLRGAAAGFCFAVNRRLSGGYCFASLHLT